MATIILGALLIADIIAIVVVARKYRDAARAKWLEDHEMFSVPKMFPKKEADDDVR